MLKRLLILALLASLLSACLVVRVSDGYNQTCPNWISSSPDAKCDIRIWKTAISSYEDVDMTYWNEMRFTTVGGEVLFDNYTNIVVLSDLGEKIDYTSSRLSAGTYLVEKVDTSLPAKFRILNPHSDVIVNLIGEFVHPAETK